MLQNKAAKLVLDKPLYSSATDALNQLGWLNLKQLRHFHRCLYVYNCVKGITSHKLELSRNSDVHRYNTRCKDHPRLPSAKRNWGKQRTCYHALKTGMPWTVTWRTLALYVSLGIIFLNLLIHCLLLYFFNICNFYLLLTI